MSLPTPFRRGCQPRSDTPFRPGSDPLPRPVLPTPLYPQGVGSPFGGAFLNLQTDPCRARNNLTRGERVDD
jgi:hypothetical protein